MSLAKWLAPALLAPALIAPMAPLATAADVNATPIGTWQLSTGESRFDVNYCDGGAKICARLTWLRADARTPENLAYLNRLVVTAAPEATNAWHGTVVYDGHEYSGSVQMLSENSLRLSGCQGIFCKSMTLTRLV
jgi:uncharacterized protein (DUF2147 family)